MGGPRLVTDGGEWPEREHAGRRRVECVGESNYQDVLESIAGGKQRESQEIGTNAVIRRQPVNPYDANAIQVLIGGRLVAYLPRAVSAEYAPAMDRARTPELPVPAEVRGGWRDGADEGHFGVVVWLAELDSL